MIDAPAAVIPADGLGAGLPRRVGKGTGPAAVPAGKSNLHLHVASRHGERVLTAIPVGKMQFPSGAQIGYRQPIQLIIASGVNLNGDTGPLYG